LRALHAANEKPVAVAAILFCVVHRDIGVDQQKLFVIAVLGVGGDADAARNTQAVVGDAKRAVQCLQDFFCNQNSIAFLLYGWEQNDELVATDARNGVGSTYGGQQALGDLDEQQVSDVVAKGVVDRLELVQIEKHDGHVLFIALCADYSLL